MIEHIKNLRMMMGDRRGVAAVEYGLIAALIAVTIIAIMGTLDGGLKAAFTTIANKLTNPG